MSARSINGNKMRSSLDTNARHTPTARRVALKKITISSAVAGSALALPSSWVKPVINVAILPAHATCSPESYGISVAVIGFEDTPPPRGTVSATIEITSGAPDESNAVAIESITVSSGTLIGATIGLVYAGNSNIFGWLGFEETGEASAVLEAMGLSITYTCANDRSVKETHH